ncbi:MAG: fasciclin domain-containing protein [Anaerolineae bacterium]
MHQTTKFLFTMVLAIFMLVAGLTQVLAAPATPAQLAIDPLSAIAEPAVNKVVLVAGLQAVTKTQAMTETQAMTKTQAMTETQAMTKTQAMTGTQALTETQALTGTQALTQTGAVTGTGATTTATGACAQTYTIQTGESLSSIAGTLLGDGRAFATIVDATNQAAATDPQYSNITDPNLVQVGQKLCIPGSAGAVSQPAVVGQEATPAGSVVTTSLEMAEEPTIVDVIRQDGRFGMAVQALENAQLVELLQSKGPFTVFMPTDAAFIKLPVTDLNSLLADPINLPVVLQYHVISGTLTGSAVASRSSLNTLEGSPITISLVDGRRIFLNNNAEVSVPDLTASNGVIHGIDNVLFPPAKVEATPVTTSTTTPLATPTP